MKPRGTGPRRRSGEPLPQRTVDDAAPSRPGVPPIRNGPASFTNESMLEAEADPGLLRSPAELLARSRAVVDRFGFLDSWFEEGAEVEQLLGGKRRARAKRVALVRESLLPKHAVKWGDRLARIALLLRHCEDEEPWQELFVSAKEVLAGRPLAEVPLMTRVAENTVDAYTASRSAGRMKRQRRPPFFVH